MRVKFLSLLIVIAVCFNAPVRAEQTPEEILNAVIKIKATIPADAFSAQVLGTEREGNGVVIDANGHIVTIGYLILEAERIEVISAQAEPVEGRFVAYDYKTGFGIIRADPPLPVKPLQLGQSSQLNAGDPILIAGYGGSEAVLGSRVVSRKEFVGYWEYLLEDAIYTTPPYPNYGGAALIDSNGRLLGIGSIYTQLRVPEIGIVPCNMSVPIDHLKPILDDLIKTGRSSLPAQPWLGLNADEAHGRVFVIRITSGGPSEKAGLKVGDIILAVNKKPVNGLADFFRQSWALGPAGVEVPLSILQDTQVREVRVKSADRYQFLKVSRQR